MWPFLSRSLFPPPSQAWLQMVSSDPEAQGWGAWNETKETLGPEGGEGKEEEEEAEEDQDGDAGFLLSLLEQENLAECPVPDQELEAIKMKVCAMEQAEGLPWSPGAQHQAEEEEGMPQPPGVQHQAKEEEGTTAGQLLSPEAMGCPLPGTPEEKVEADHRSVYVGNVDYGGSAEELEAHFSRCGEVHRVTILCDKFSGHPKGCCQKEPTSPGSAPQTAGAFEDTQAPGGHPSPSAASRAGPGSDHKGRTGPVENSHRGFHRIKGKA
ncbi:embryonic polyadenylate-binding protein 2 isoform X2 [Rhinopithecus roxellana]|uniref:embryonic polyadenylate-binding protein 2 isoform X2 n=1 Tax=Rhinopithecus roxellana TaxID=61622 RepID=UPI00123799CD|nr:embryonic polyadenylate-binding protein 2 isoform X2 [Rhinopithecus roxellana]